MDDPYDLQRFLAAQEDVYQDALSEIRSGRKASHWMWFIFPQLGGLGTSPTSRHFAIGGADEARAYLANPILCRRLVEAAQAVLSSGDSPADIFGFPDDMKLKSCATLFAAVTAPGSVFEQLLTQCFDGDRDARTLALLGLRSD